jgi:hypothetical protein
MDELGKFEKFNKSISYLSTNITKSIWTVIWFLIKIGGILLFAFPFIFLGMCLVSPNYALNTITVITTTLETIIKIFGGT